MRIDRKTKYTSKFMVELGHNHSSIKQEKKAESEYK